MLQQVTELLCSLIGTSKRDFGPNRIEIERYLTMPCGTAEDRFWDATCCLCFSMSLLLSLSLDVSVYVSAYVSVSVSVSVSVCSCLCLSMSLSIPAFVSRCLCLCLCRSMSLALSLEVDVFFAISLALSLPNECRISLAWPCVERHLRALVPGAVQGYLSHEKPPTP